MKRKTDGEWWCGGVDSSDGSDVLLYLRNITTAAYVEIFHAIEVQLDIRYVMQDDFTCHSSHASTHKIESFFDNRIISMGIRPYSHSIISYGTI